MIKIVPVRAIFQIRIIFSMSPTSKTKKNNKFSQDRVVILALHKEGKVTGRLPRLWATTSRVFRRC